jgi:hypothetical protein
VGTVTTRDGAQIYYKGWGKGQPIVVNLALVDSGIGLRLRGPGRAVVVESCEIMGNFDAVVVESGTSLYLYNSQVRSNEGGINGEDVRVFVTDGAISENYGGVFLNGYSTLDLQHVEVRGNHSGGVFAQTLSTVTAANTTFLDNGRAHVSLVDRSAFTVRASNVGQPGDATGLSIFAGDGSRATIVFDELSPGIVYGKVHAAGGSNVVVQGGTLHDGADLEDFSWAKLTDATVEGTISCQTGSDAICAGNASATVSGCGPVSSSCTGTPVPASEPPPFLKFAPEGGTILPRR